MKGVVCAAAVAGTLLVSSAAFAEVVQCEKGRTAAAVRLKPSSLTFRGERQSFGPVRVCGVKVDVLKHSVLHACKRSRDGVIDGRVVIIDTRGDRVLRGSCEAGRPAGRWVYRFEDQRWTHTYRAGLLHGLATTWHPDGRKASEGRYWNGQRAGRWRFWYGNRSRVVDYGTPKSRERPF